MHRYVARAMVSPMVASTMLLVTVLTTGSGTHKAVAPDLEPGGTFFDDDGSTHEGYIEALAATRRAQGLQPAALRPHLPGRPDHPRSDGGAVAAVVETAACVGDDSFADDEGSTFEEDINRVAAAGITRGCDAADASRFCPDELVTRGQMAAFINRGFELEPGSKDRFSDDDGSPFERGHRPGCLRRHHRGLRPGLPAAVLSPGVGDTGQMASFLGRALGLDAIRPPERPAFTLAVTGDILIHSPLVDRAAAYGDASGQSYDFRPMFAAGPAA